MAFVLDSVDLLPLGIGRRGDVDLVHRRDIANTIEPEHVVNAFQNLIECLLGRLDPFLYCRQSLFKRRGQSFVGGDRSNCCGEQDERNQQHVDDERLDQDEAEDQRAAQIALDIKDIIDVDPFNSVFSFYKNNIDFG